ncbi:fatty acid desaturase family protein [Nakamurella lactea]|uniref:fatty acid desaturase family protein n=1 Tax=Nakamurella lactea TaxID=459515 RepID=UPI00041FAAEB|nr:acyl-CoA desaturase [Nakamurella lactea]
MTATLGAAPATRHRIATDYSELAAVIHEHGLLERRYRYYAVKIGSVIAAFAAVWVAFAVVGESWAQLGIAAALGLVLTHLAFLSHDAAHRQVFHSGKANDWLARVLGSLLTGMSISWWVRKHTKHHAKPNQINFDPDIEPTVVVFYPEPDRERGRIAAFLMARQGWWFFPILIVEGLNLHAQSMVTLVGKAPVKHRWTELGMVAFRWAAYLTTLFLLLSPGMAAAFLGVQLAVFGVYMGCTFAPSHKGMPVAPENSKIDFFRRQVLMSRNITGPQFMTFAMGGLNYQVEHHLFPSMPRPNLRRAREIVMPFCAERQVPYTETSLLRAYVIVVRYLNKVGLVHRDPYQCPMVAGFRPRG